MQKSKNFKHGYPKINVLLPNHVKIWLSPKTLQKFIRNYYKNTATQWRTRPTLHSYVISVTCADNPFINYLLPQTRHSLGYLHLYAVCPHRRFTKAIIIKLQNRKRWALCSETSIGAYIHSFRYRWIKVINYIFATKKIKNVS